MAEFDFKRLIRLAQDLESFSIAADALSGPTTPILTLEGIVGGKVAQVRLAFMREGLTESREEFLTTLLRAITAYRNSLERELKSMIRPSMEANSV